MDDTITTNDVKPNTDNQGITTDSVKSVGSVPVDFQGITNNDVKGDTNTKKKYNGIANLRPVQTKEEAKERGRKGGLKSGEVRRQKKTMRETLENALKIELSKEKLEELGADTSLMNGDTSVLSAIIASTIREAINGDTKAIQFVRDSIGEQPIAKTENVTEVITKDDADLMDTLRKSLIS